MVTRMRGKVRVGSLVTLSDLPVLHLVVYELSERLAVSAAILSEVFVAADLARNVVLGLSVPRYPNLPRRKIEDLEIVDSLLGQETVQLVADDLAADIDNLDVRHVV